MKTLRFYHEQGLLIPSAIDDQTGYRYYDRNKIETARVIAQLRRLDFSLDEIAEMLRSCDDDADILDFLMRQRAAVAAKIERIREVERLLDQVITHEQEARIAMASADYQVEERELDAMLIAAVRMHAKYSDCGQGFATIARRFARQMCGKPMLLHHDAEYRELADYEACVPIRKGSDVEGISVRVLPGGRAVTLLHKGPYTELGRSYERILAYVKERGYEVHIPSREVYLKGPGMIFKGNPKNYLTEIQMLIKQG